MKLAYNLIDIDTKVSDQLLAEISRIEGVVIPEVFIDYNLTWVLIKKRAGESIACSIFSKRTRLAKNLAD